MTKALVPPIPGLLYAVVENFGQHYDNGGRITTDIAEANVITSLVERDVMMHKVVVDIDLPAVLLPSSTPGHFHLYIDKEIPKDKYFALLFALADAGLVEPGYADASRDQGRSAVRLPWIKKGEPA